MLTPGRGLPGGPGAKAINPEKWNKAHREGKFATRHVKSPQQREEIREVGRLAREYTVHAIERLAKIAKSDGMPAVRACQILLDRGWGKLPQEIEIHNVRHLNTPQLLDLVPDALKVLGDAGVQSLARVALPSHVSNGHPTQDE